LAQSDGADRQSEFQGFRAESAGGNAPARISGEGEVMSMIHFANQETRHFLIDSKGDLYEVSKEIAEKHSQIHPKETAVVSSIDEKTNTIWFESPLPKSVRAD
jgi:hypothetical protein